VVQKPETSRRTVGIAFGGRQRGQHRFQKFPALLLQAVHDELIGPRLQDKSFAATADRNNEERSMIRLTRLKGLPLVLNSDLIEHIDVTPDTVITLTTGQILRVRESADQVVRRIVEFRRSIYGPEAQPAGPRDEAETAQAFETPEEDRSLG
jgi:flagellar protein FlbD